MSGGEARHGRRSNGLYAAEYAAVGDVDPRVGEHLLDVLGNRGIAAYLQPTVDQHPITRMSTLPSRPTDRLYVDRAEVSAARKFLDMVGDMTQNEPPPRTDLATPAARTSIEFEAAWASIVAGFDQTAAVDEPTRPGLAAADAPEEPPEPPRAWPRWRGPDSDDSLIDGVDRLGSGYPDEDEEDFEPPPPPPLPRFAHATIAGVLGVLLGIIVIIDPGLLPIDPSAAVVLGGLALLAGAVALIGRLRPGDEDDDSDDGAVV